MYFGRLLFNLLLVLAGMVLGIYLAFNYPHTTKSWLAYFGCTNTWCTEQTEHADRHPYDQLFEENAMWLAKNLYYHRGEENTERGRKAVAAVVFNRMTDKDHNFGPRTVKGVITFGYVSCQCACAFSWYCDGRDDTPDNLVRYENDLRLARIWLEQYYEGTFADPTHGATWFHYRGDEYPDAWPVLEPAGEFGQYAFYRYPGSR